MMTRSALCTLMATGIVGLAGCHKDGEELLGVWAVTSHTENDLGCDVEGAAVADPAFIKFVEGSFFGQDYYEYVACTDAGGAACEEPGFLFGLLYAEPIDGGMRAAIYAASGSPDDCLLSATVSDAVVAGAALRIETRRRVQDNVTGTRCDADDAQARAGSLPCDGLEVLVGARP
jgi:hypothetical protein